MGFFSDDDKPSPPPSNDDYGFKMMFGFIKGCTVLLAKSAKSGIDEIRVNRQKAQIIREAEAYKQMVQSQGSPAETPANLTPSIAKPDLSPPPKRNRNG